MLLLFTCSLPRNPVPGRTEAAAPSTILTPLLSAFEHSQRTQVGTYRHCLGVHFMDISASLITTTLSRGSILLYKMRKTAPLLTSPLLTVYTSSLVASLSPHTHLRTLISPPPHGKTFFVTMNSSSFQGHTEGGQSQRSDELCCSPCSGKVLVLTLISFTHKHRPRRLITCRPPEPCMKSNMVG